MSIESVAPRDLQYIHYYTHRTDKVQLVCFQTTTEHSLPLHVASSKWMPQDVGGSFKFIEQAGDKEWPCGLGIYQPEYWVMSESA